MNSGSMIRVALRLVLLAIAAACSAPPRKPPPPTNAAAPPAPTPCDLSWIDGAASLRVTERTDGHEGYFEFEIELRREGAAFVGTASASYRQHERAPPVLGTREIRVPSASVEATLTAIRTSFDSPPDPDAEKRISTHESWHTVRLAIELVGAARARLATNEGHVRPTPWHLDGCDRKLPHPGRARFGKAYDELEKLIARQALYEVLEKQSRP
jgi:hypothetical protein